MAATDPKKDNAYNTKVLSKWFAISSIILLIVVIWGTLADYDREWKSYARQEHRILAAKAQAKLVENEAKTPIADQLTKLNAELKELQSKQSDLLPDLDAKYYAANAVFYKANQTFQFTKANLDADLFTLDTAVAHQDPKAAELKNAWKVLQAKVIRLKNEANAAEKLRDQADADRKEYLKKQKELSDKIVKLSGEKNRLEKVVSKNEMSLGYLVRNAPVVDFISPTVKISQIVLPDLKDDYFFNQVPRVDRCMTCHANIDKAGFENLPQPFKSHPKLNLYMAADSAHPMERVGCTVCHAGIPQSVDFSLAGHTPKDNVQRQEWEQRYNFQPPRHLTSPMIPTHMVEGKCIQCHSKNVQLADAPTYNAGMRLIERYGCYGCHKIAGHFEKLSKEKKPGPSLKMIASKVTKDWAIKFAYDPKSYRPSSLMPRFWKNHNNSDPDSMERGKVEVDAIVNFLFKKSVPYEPLKLASHVTGNVERGKDLVGKVGCVACHSIADFPRTNPENATDPGWKDPRVPLPGPELNQLGSKVTKEWLQSWLINPKHYWEGTVMPSLKLSEQEVADIASYLIEKRNPEFDAMSVPEAKDSVRDEVVTTYLNASMSPAEATVKLASMSLEDKKMYLGEKLITHYGCYGCHAIEGFENFPGVGAELTLEGSKDLSKFSFENLHNLPHYRHEWIYTKIRTPRVWDVGKTRDFEAKTKMPYFGFTHDQAVALTAIILGLENKKVADESIFKVDGRWEQIIAGQRQANRLNCVACHTIENMGGGVLAHFSDDPTMGPPNLNTQGLKTQTDWLYSFLLNPNVRIRPWISIRMPQFWMQPAEALTFTKYFAAKDRADYPYVLEPLKPVSAEEEKIAKSLIEKQGCLTCHGVRKPGEDESAAAPHFANIKRRLKHTWIPLWITNPGAIMPGTRMPTLWPSSDDNDPKAPLIGVEGILGGDAKKQIELLERYLAQYPGDATVPTTRVDPPKFVPGVTTASADSGAKKAEATTKAKAKK